MDDLTGVWERESPKLRQGTMAQIAIRQLNEDDASDFQELRLRGLREHPEAFGSTFERESAYSMEFVAGRLRLAAASPDNCTLGAHLQGKLIGVVGFIRKTRDTERHRGEIWGMYVVSEEQGKGIGRSLITNAIERARSLRDLSRSSLRSSFATMRPGSCTPRSALNLAESTRGHACLTESISMRSVWSFSCRRLGSQSQAGTLSNWQPIFDPGLAVSKR